MRHRKIVSSIFHVALTLVLSACSEEAARSPLNPSPTTTATTAATAVGTTIGSASTTTIGSGGGSLSSPDSRMTLSIPAGALTATTVIGIQPITNNAHGGIGNGYRLTPDGQTFQQPVSMRFTYTDQDLIGTAVEALGVAYQSSDGSWHWVNSPVVDTAARTVTVTTTHLSDYSFVEGVNLRPRSATVGVGETVALQIRHCYPDDDASFLSECDEEQLAPLPTSAPTEWAVNGVPGGNSTLGTIGGDHQSATFRAPQTKPTPNTVAVTARLVDRRKVTFLQSNITIVDQREYTGTVRFTYSVSGGSLSGGFANVTWTKYEDDGELRRYLGSGTISGDLLFTDCDPVHAELPMEPGTPANPRSSLGLLTAQHPSEPKTYEFGVQASGTITLRCGTPRQSIPTPAGGLLRFDLRVFCPKPSFTDETTLSGSCNSDGANASWTFNRR